MSNEIITKKYLINGPHNVVRLTDDKKVLYIFGDFHYPENEQNECAYSDKYDSMDIDKFLLKFIKTEKNKNYDLFTEIFDYDYKRKNLVANHRYKYIDQIRKLFQSKIEINNNKIIQNKKYPNFKFHFFDIRNILVDFNNFYNYFISINITIPYDAKYKLLNIINTTKNLIIYLNNLLIQLKNKENEYIKKLFDLYENKEIKSKMNKILNDICIDNINNNIKKANELLKYIESNKMIFQDKFYDENKLMDIHVNIYFSIKSILKNTLNIYCLLSDLFFIRRFLDKDYITNTIVYTGMLHLNDIMYILVKYFNFKVTNYYYCQKDNLDNINNLIINLKSSNFDYIKILEKYFYKESAYEYNTQCINLFDFPNNFN